MNKERKDHGIDDPSMTTLASENAESDKDWQKLRFDGRSVLGEANEGGAEILFDGDAREIQEFQIFLWMWGS